MTCKHAQKLRFYIFPPKSVGINFYILFLSATIVFCTGIKTKKQCRIQRKIERKGGARLLAFSILSSSTVAINQKCHLSSGSWIFDHFYFQFSLRPQSFELAFIEIMSKKGLFSLRHKSMRQCFTRQYTKSRGLNLKTKGGP